MDAEVLINIGLNAGDVAKQLNDVTVAIVKCKAEQKLLNDQLKNGEITYVEYEQSMAAVKDEMSALTKEQKGLVAQQKILTEDSKSYADTLNGQRQRLNDLTKAYDSLDASMRDSSAGQAFRDQIREQSEAIQELEEATNRHQRNVGNYPKTITSIIPGFDKMNDVLGKLGTSMEQMSTNGGKAFSNLGKSVTTFGKAFITPPIAVITAVLSAIVLVVTKVVDAFKKNDGAMTALQRAFSAFQPVLDVVNKAFEVLAVAIGNVVQVASQAVVAIASLIPGYEEAAAAADELVVAQDNLEETERQYTQESAKRNRDIAKLRDEAVAAGDPSVRVKKMQEAIYLEAKNLEDEKKIKAERLRLLEEEARQNADTSDEMQDKIAAARAAMYQAEEAYYTGTRRLQAQLRSAQDEIAKEEAAKAKAAADEAKRRREERKRAEEQAAKEAAAQAKAEADTLAELQKQAEDMRIAAIKDADDKALQERMAAGNREIDALKAKYETDKTLTAESREILNQIIIQKQQELDAQLEQMEADAFEAKKQAAADRAVEEQEFILNARKDALAARSAETEEDEIALEEERFQTQMELMRLQMQEELNQIDLTEAEKFALQEKWDAIFVQQREQYEAKKNEIIKRGIEVERKIAEAGAKSVSNMLGQMSDALTMFGEDNKEAAVLSKIIALGKIAIDTGVAISAAVAGATAAAAATGPAAPFTQPAFIAQMIATLMASITTAISTVKGAKFATGGIVPGTYDAKDSVRASLSGGEMVLNPAQQKRLFEVANVGMSESFDYERMAAAVAVGVSEMPAPVLDYKEFTTFEDNVATVDELSRI